MNIEKIKQETLTDKAHLTLIVSDVIDIANKKVDAVEVSINKSTGINVSTRLGETENVEFNNDGALSITVYQNQRKGTASTNDLSPKAIEQTIDMAMNIMKYTSSDPCSGLADKELMAYDNLDLELFHPGDLDVDYAISQAIEAERAALSCENIKNSDGGYFNSSRGFFIYGNSHNMLQGYCASSHSLSCSVIAERDGNMEREYAYTSSRDINQLQSAQHIGQEAAQKAVAHLGSKQIATMQIPVLFSPEVATGLIGHLAGAINGYAIYKKSSFLIDQIGQQILPDWFNIQERPHILRGIGSAPFDREGVKTKNQTIIEDGMLQTYLLSSYSARKLSSSAQKFQSTGHAGGIHNWLVESTQPPNSFEQMVKMLHKGVIITSLMGQGVNGVTGDYSRGATGFWVENGQIQYPISEFTIAGNLKDFYKKIVAVGNDIETRTNIQCGSILIEEMSIAGK